MNRYLTVNHHISPLSQLASTRNTVLSFDCLPPPPIAVTGHLLNCDIFSTQITTGSFTTTFAIRSSHSTFTPLSIFLLNIPPCSRLFLLHPQRLLLIDISFLPTTILPRHSSSFLPSHTISRSSLLHARHFQLASTPPLSHYSYIHYLIHRIHSHEDPYLLSLNLRCIHIHHYVFSSSPPYSTVTKALPTHLSQLPRDTNLSTFLLTSLSLQLLFLIHELDSASLAFGLDSVSS